MIKRPDTNAQRLKRHKRVRGKDLRHARETPSERVPQREPTSMPRSLTM